MTAAILLYLTECFFLKNCIDFLRESLQTPKYIMYVFNYKILYDNHTDLTQFFERLGCIGLYPLLCFIKILVCFTKEFFR